MATELSLSFSYEKNFIRDIGDYLYIKYNITFSTAPDGDKEEDIIDIIVSKHEIYLKYMSDTSSIDEEDKKSMIKEWILDLVRTIEIDQMYFLESIFTDSFIDDDNNNTVFNLKNQTFNLCVKFDNTDGELINIWKEDNEEDSDIGDLSDVPPLYNL